MLRPSHFALLLLSGVLLAAQEEPDRTSKKLAASEVRARVGEARRYAKGGSQDIPELVTLLSDREREVRVEAVKSLVQIGTQHGLEPLVKATSDTDPEVQIRATDGLVNYYLPGYVQSGISGSFKRLSTNVKSRFTDTNDQIIDPNISVDPTVVSALGKVARGGINMESRANAARAVGILRGKAAVPDLIAAMRSKNDDVLYESLIALQKIRDPEVAPQITYLLRDFNDRVQIAALETTGLLNNQSALPDLQTALTRARNNKVRRAALSAIAMLPAPESRNLYAQYFQDTDEGLRTASAEGYARLKDPADVTALDRAYYAERKTAPRLALAFALVNLGNTGTGEGSPLATLVSALDGKSYRGVAQAYLVELAREQAVRQTLYGYLTPGTKDQRIALAGVLAQVGAADSVKPLEALSRDGDGEVAQEGMRALRIVNARLQSVRNP